MTARDDSGASIRSPLTLAIAGQSRHLGRFHRGCSKSSGASVSELTDQTLAIRRERMSGAGPQSLVWSV